MNDEDADILKQYVSKAHKNLEEENLPEQSGAPQSKVGRSGRNSMHE